MFRRSGFTLVELLVVIAIITLLSSIVIASMSEAREKAKIARTQEELTSIRNAVTLLQHDTGKWPCGCLPGQLIEPEVSINSVQAGLRTSPLPGFRCPEDLSPECGWTAEDVSKWKGPYVNFDLVDPWENDYRYDSDYFPLMNRQTPCGSAACNRWQCPDAPAAVSGLGNGDTPPPNWRRSAVYSFGPAPLTQFIYDAPCFTTGDCYGCREVYAPLY
ncbi:MAG: prepilin-type N-terminal cleavage/methylation domain-containing protein [Patescibacteria group bacterium]